MKNLKIIKEYYYSLSDRGKLCFTIAVGLGICLVLSFLS